MSEYKHVLITGATSGIGMALAESLMSKGIPVVACGRNEERLKTYIRGGGCYFNYDLTDVEGAQRCLEELLLSQRINIKGFVHCAGIAPIIALNLMDYSDMQDIFNVNFVSAVEILKVLTRREINNNFLKSVVFVSSISSVKGYKGLSAYCASKSAMDAFARAMALELGPDVRVNTVRPGALPTGVLQKAVATSAIFDMFENPAKYGYLLEGGAISDAVELIEYLLSDEARWITGQCFNVDGGVTAH